MAQATPCILPVLILAIFLTRVIVLTSSLFIPNALSSRSRSSPLSMAATPNSAPSKSVLSIGPNHLRPLLQHASRQMQQSDDGLDLHGIVWMEHLNLVVGCMETAEKFYVDFLGLTVDAGNSKHFNLGQQQFHLAANNDPPQRVAGSICLAVPNLERIRQRAQLAQTGLKGTLFCIHEYDDLMKDKMMTVTCPWGNTFHLYDISIDDDIAGIDFNVKRSSPHKMVNLHLEGGAYGSNRMAVRGGPGIRAVEIACRNGTVNKIARFYETCLGCTVISAKVDNVIKSEAVSVSVGPGVQLVFVESEHVSDEDFEIMNGVHLCIYIANFKNIYTTLKERGLIWTNPRFTHLDSCDTWEEAFVSQTFRFKDILDVDTGEKVLELEHETRPMMHGQYMKVPKYILN